MDWSLAYATIDERSRRTAQRAFLDDLDRADAYRADGPTLWDADFGTAVAQAELADREVDGAWYSLAFGQFTVDTTRPELLPACVALVVHPSDERYAGLVGSSLRTPVFGVEVPTSSAYRSSDGCTTSATQAGSSSGRVVSTVNCPNASEYHAPSTSRSASSACATAVPKSASQSVGPSAR